MTLYIMISYGEEIKRFSQRYDRMEEHSNIFATNLMKKVKTRRLKRKLPQDLYLIVML